MKKKPPTTPIIDSRILTNLLTSISLLVSFSLELRHQGFPSSFFREEKVEEEEGEEGEEEDGVFVVGFEIW